MSEILLQSVVEAVNAQEKTMRSMQQDLQEVKTAILSLAGMKEPFMRLNNQVETLQTSISRGIFPLKDMRELSRNLSEATAVSRRPVPHKHYHHVPLLAWITAGMFLVLSLVTTGWYMTGQKLKEYKASDTKYRYLKLDTGRLVLQKQLYLADSLYRVKDFRDSIIQEEAARQRDYELRLKAATLEQEAETLRNKTRNK